MVTLHWANLLIDFFLAFSIGYFYCKFSKPSADPVVEEPKKKKVYVPKYQAGDLLDPISPVDQRLERRLEIEAKKQEEEV